MPAVEPPWFSAVAPVDDDVSEEAVDPEAADVLPDDTEEPDDDAPVELVPLLIELLLNEPSEAPDPLLLPSKLPALLLLELLAPPPLQLEPLQVWPLEVLFDDCQLPAEVLFVDDVDPSVEPEFDVVPVAVPLFMSVFEVDVLEPV